ncbi:MAG TPA: hypothetical protein VM120_12315 [Bryobacteraceae bacterium]|nr:hypothetical protein [Bryobacteraceae bacterium]
MGDSQTKKLDELRAKTDRQLLTIIGKQIQLGLALADAVGNHDNPRQRAAAESDYCFAVTVLPTLSHLSEQDQKQLQTELKELRRRLDGGVPLRARAVFAAGIQSKLCSPDDNFLP